MKRVNIKSTYRLHLTTLEELMVIQERLTSHKTITEVFVCQWESCYRVTNQLNCAVSDVYLFTQYMRMKLLKKLFRTKICNTIAINNIISKYYTSSGWQFITVLQVEVSSTSSQSKHRGPLTYRSGSPGQCIKREKLKLFAKSESTGTTRHILMIQCYLELILHTFTFM